MTHCRAILCVYVGVKVGGLLSSDGIKVSCTPPASANITEASIRNADSLLVDSDQPRDSEYSTQGQRL